MSACASMRLTGARLEVKSSLESTITRPGALYTAAIKSAQSALSLGCGGEQMLARLRGE